MICYCLCKKKVNIYTHTFPWICIDYISKGKLQISHILCHWKEELKMRRRFFTLYSFVPLEF